MKNIHSDQQQTQVAEFIQFLSTQKHWYRPFPFKTWEYDWEEFENDARRMLKPLFPKGCFFIHPIERAGTKVMIFHPNYGVVTGADNRYMRPEFNQHELIDLLFAPQIMWGKETVINSRGAGSASWSLEINKYYYAPVAYCGEATIETPKYGGYYGCDAHGTCGKAMWFKKATGIDPYEQAGVTTPGDRTVEEKLLWLNDYKKWWETFGPEREKMFSK